MKPDIDKDVLWDLVYICIIYNVKYDKLQSMLSNKQRYELLILCVDENYDLTTLLLGDIT